MSTLLGSAGSGPAWLQDSANATARKFNLECVPSVRVVDSVVPPFLRAGTGGPLVILPARFLESLNPENIGLIIKHELSHFVRKDHVSGATASVACLFLWWNPIAWWIRRETRTLQEACCDQLVLDGNAKDRHR